MNAYEMKQQARKERLERASERAMEASDAAWEKAPYAPYQLSNLSARIRDAKKRQGRIERTRAMSSSSESIGIATVIADVDDNRVVLKFPARIARDDYKKVRGWGFVWSPTRGGFVRKLSPGALEWARQLAQQITTTEATCRKS